MLDTTQVIIWHILRVFALDPLDMGLFLNFWDPYLLASEWGVNAFS